MKIVLCVAAALLGYLCLYLFLKDRTDPTISRGTVATISAVLYAILLAVSLLFEQYLGEPGLLVYYLALMHSCFFAGWEIWHLCKTRPAVHRGMMLALAGYGMALLYITLFIREAGSQYSVQLDVFHWLEPAGSDSSTTPLRDCCMNIALFFPLGLGLMLAVRGMTRWEAAAWGLLLSTAIETIQLASHSGTFDVVDILANAVGGLLGAVLGKAILKRHADVVKGGRR